MVAVSTAKSLSRVVISAAANVPCLRSQSAPHKLNLRHTHAAGGAAAKRRPHTRESMRALGASGYHVPDLSPA